MTLAVAIDRLQVIAGGLSGVKSAPDGVPDQASMFPFAVSYPSSGSFKGMGSGWTQGLHVIITEIHCAASILPQAVAQAQAYIEVFSAAVLADPTLDGAVNTLVASEETALRYEFGRLRWGSVETVGVRFYVTVKI